MTDNPNPGNGTEEVPVEPAQNPQQPAGPTEPQAEPQNNPPAADPQDPPAQAPAQEPASGDPPPADPQQPSEPDYREKFGESTRENQILSERNKELENQIRELTNPPTDSELQAAFPDWDEMTTTEQRSSKLAFEAKRTSEKIAAERQLERLDQQWKDDLNVAITAHPELDGKEAAFREFASKKTHKGAPLDVLVDAFLHKSGSAPPTSPSTPRQGLEPGTGGPKTPDKPKLLPASELKKLRETNYEEYRKYVSTHDVSDIEE